MRLREVEKPAQVKQVRGVTVGFEPRMSVWPQTIQLLKMDFYADEVLPSNQVPSFYLDDTSLG